MNGGSKRRKYILSGADRGQIRRALVSPFGAERVAERKQNDRAGEDQADDGQHHQGGLA